MNLYKSDSGTNSMLTKCHVSSLSQFFEVIEGIAQTVNRMLRDSYSDELPADVQQVLWFRGLSSMNYNLIPSLLRNNECMYISNNSRYTALSLQEDLYFQHFSAKAGHKTRTQLTNYTDWIEVMQHYSAPSRLLDWSASAMVALIFALEKILDPKAKRDLKSDFSPVVYVHNPFLVNQEVYRRFCLFKEGKCYDLIEDALFDLVKKESVRRKIAIELGDRMIDKSEICYYSIVENIHRKMCSKKTMANGIDGIVSLSAIDSMYRNERCNLLQRLRTGECNLFYYLIYRFYIQGIPVKSGVLPPLSIVHQYHSERIEAQKGTFSIFPNYITDEFSYKEYILGTDLRCMESQKQIQRYLFSIQLDDPYRIARDIHLSGERYTTVYPELERYSNEITMSAYRF